MECPVRGVYPWFWRIYLGTDYYLQGSIFNFYIYYHYYSLISQEQLGNSDLVIGFPGEEDFNMLDKDDDGVLTEEEFKNVIGC